MMHNFQNIKDIGALPGVAGKKTNEQREIDQSKARLLGTTVEKREREERRFTNPASNVKAMGIEPGMKVADFGAGSGAYSLAAARAVGYAGKVYAVDVQKDLLTRIKNHAEGEKMDWLEIIWGDFETLGGSRIADHSVDMVILSNVLFQLDHVPSALGEAKRILKINGSLAIIDWLDSFGGMGPEPKRVIPKEKALELAYAAGFTVLREFQAGEHHYGIIFKPAKEKTNQKENA